MDRFLEDEVPVGVVLQVGDLEQPDKVDPVPVQVASHDEVTERRKVGHTAPPVAVGKGGTHSLAEQGDGAVRVPRAG
jgi:hypothetical protein